MSTNQSHTFGFTAKRWHLQKKKMLVKLTWWAHYIPEVNVFSHQVTPQEKLRSKRFQEAAGVEVTSATNAAAASTSTNNLPPWLDNEGGGPKGSPRPLS